MKILSLNGGGSLGYILAVFLEKYEEETGKPCKDSFDLIAGVSTGSIIGYALSIGIPAFEIRELYERFVPSIFEKKRNFLMSIFYPYYDMDKMKDIFEDFFGDKKISEAQTKFMTYATDVSSEYVGPKFWKSWKSDAYIVDILCSSSAAPLYFSPYEFDGTTYADGAMSCNSPNISALVEAHKMGHKIEDISMLNLSMNGLRGYDNPKKELTGLINVATEATSISIFGSEQMETHESEVLLGDRFIGLNPYSELPVDTKNIEELGKIGIKLWEDNKEEVLAKFN